VPAGLVNLYLLKEGFVKMAASQNGYMEYALLTMPSDLMMQ
jgi:hypothetical protein